MPSAKRERKREGQAARRAALEAQRKKEQQRRTLIRTVGIIGAVLVVGLIITTLARRGGDKTDVASGSTTTIGEGGTSTTTPSNLAVPPGKPITGDTPCPAADGSSERSTAFEKAPPMCIDAARSYQATFETDIGTFKATLDAKKAPKTVNNLVVLARYHFFDGIAFHRVIPDFVIQGGDPQGTGGGGPGYKFDDELPQAGEYKDGTLAMANSGENTNGSQFFVINGAQGRSLPPKYNLFGQVTEGLDVVQKIMADGDPSGTPKVVHKMVKVTVTES